VAGQALLNWLVSQGSNLYSFWTQTLVNGTWQAFPANLEAALHEEGGLAGFVQHFLDDLHLGWLWNDISEMFEWPRKLA
jgi:hypothetical protein